MSGPEPIAAVELPELSFELPELPGGDDDEPTDGYQHAEPVMSPAPDDGDFNNWQPPSGASFQAPSERSWQPSFLGGAGGGAVDPVHSPMWSQFRMKAGDGNIYRLKIQRVDDMGDRFDLGFLQGDASQYHLIAMFKRAGKYLIMPINELGKPQQVEPEVCNVAADHPYLLKILSGAAAGASMGVPAGGMGMGGMGMGAEMIGYLTTKDQLAYEKDRDSKTLKAEQDQRLNDEWSKVHQATASLATQSVETTIGVFSKVMETNSEQAAAMAKQATDAAARLQAQSDAAHTRDMERIQSQYAMLNKQQAELSAASIAMNKEGYNSFATMMQANVQSQMISLEKQALRDDKNMQIQQKMNKERDQERALAAERQSVRDKEHMQILVGLMQQKADNSNPMASMMGMIVSATPMLKAFGMEPSDVVDNIKDMMGGGAAKGIVGEIGETLRELIKAGVQGGMPQIPQVPDAQLEVIEEYVDEHGNVVPGPIAGEQQQIGMQPVDFDYNHMAPLVTIQLPSGKQVQLPGDTQLIPAPEAPVPGQQLTEHQMAFIGQQQQLEALADQQAAGQPPQAPMTHEQQQAQQVQAANQGHPLAELAAMGANVPNQAQPAGLQPLPALPQQAAPSQATVPTGWGAPPPQAAPAATTDPAANLDPAVKKTARRAIAELVDTIKELPKDQWQAAVIATLTAHGTEVIPYFTAVTIRRALKDAGADDQLANEAITMLDAMPVGKDIPRG